MAKLTEGKTPGDFLLFEEDKFYSRKRVTIAAGADLEPGAVLGAITASGKLQSSVRTATDGSESPVAVLLEPAAAAGSDVEATVLARGPAQVRRYGLGFDASWATEANRDTACAALEAVGIVCLAD
ncbi:hypothetical protein ATO8_21151 [Roseivivax marinus]|uniref:Head decoration protein n=1 Tax=Roseivivax marinus TaxID=1379903 RepID=W4HF76_9RHOB|nr:head decoration protein [Roseivivax marinus]ETW10645.1 hypothetical protein ATO8_21151 [Roseivivax marinus]